jgi:hypothetical protein
MFKKLWRRTKEVATMYTGTFVVVMILNQLLFFGFCLNPVCLIAAMPHVLFITVVIGTWLNKNNDWGNVEVAEKTIKHVGKIASSTAELNKKLEEVNDELTCNLEVRQNDSNNGITVVDNLTSHGYKFLQLHDEKSHSLNADVVDHLHARAEKCRDYDDIDNYIINTQIYEEPPSWLVDVPPWSEDEVRSNKHSCIENRHEVKIIKEFNGHGVFALWHMTHKDNIKEILNKGILSNTLAYEKTRPKDISNHSVQKWRESNDPIYERKIHDYAAAYINIKNPMLYVRRDMQNELCLIEISLSVLSDDNFIFTDGNASARDTKFYNLVDDLEKLPWEVLNASYWNNFEDGKRKRCAEVLIYPSIAPEYIKNIHCYSDSTLQQLTNINCNYSVS